MPISLGDEQLSTHHLTDFEVRYSVLPNNLSSKSFGRLMMVSRRDELNHCLRDKFLVLIWWLDQGYCASYTQITKNISDDGNANNETVQLLLSTIQFLLANGRVEGMTTRSSYPYCCSCTAIIQYANKHCDRSWQQLCRKEPMAFFGLVSHNLLKHCGSAVDEGTA